MIRILGESKGIQIEEYDLLVVGSGPAGMTIANELKDCGLKICVVESGKKKPTLFGDRLRLVKSRGIQIKEYSRERVLGGASTTWAGLSSPLDPADFKKRSFVKDSGWPIRREELIPFYEQASASYRFPSMEFFQDQGLEEIKRTGDIRLHWREIQEKNFLAAEDPQNFGKEFQHIFDSPFTDLLLDATLVELKGDREAWRAARGLIQTSKGDRFEIKAKAFVLATGGIETARILLNSRDLCEQGMGNENDQVGRRLMNHPKNYYGVIRLMRPSLDSPYYFGCLYKGYAGYAGMRLKESVQEEKGLLNSYVRFEPLFPWSDNQGVESLVLLAKKFKLILSGFKKLKKGRVVSIRDYSETGDDSDLQNERRSLWGWAGLFFNILFHLPSVLAYLYFRLAPGAVPKIKRVRLRNFMEMAPDPNNRITLSDQKDVLGQPVPLVSHQCSDLDKNSLIVLHQTLMKEIQEQGLGRLDSNLEGEKTWPIVQDASHHLGAARMGKDPRTSVVNPNLRLHTVKNVYVAGGAVFPTSGCANPTFTIVALSIRLAKHLKENAFGKEKE